MASNFGFYGIGGERPGQILNSAVKGVAGREDRYKDINADKLLEGIERPDKLHVKEAPNVGAALFHPKNAFYKGRDMPGVKQRGADGLPTKPVAVVVGPIRKLITSLVKTALMSALRFPFDRAQFIAQMQPMTATPKGWNSFVTELSAAGAWKTWCVRLAMTAVNTLFDRFIGRPLFMAFITFGANRELSPVIGAPIAAIIRSLASTVSMDPLELIFIRLLARNAPELGGQSPSATTMPSSLKSAWQYVREEFLEAKAVALDVYRNEGGWKSLYRVWGHSLVASAIASPSIYFLLTSALLPDELNSYDPSLKQAFAHFGILTALNFAAFPIHTTRRRRMLKKAGTAPTPDEGRDLFAGASFSLAWGSISFFIGLVQQRVIV